MQTTRPSLVFFYPASSEPAGILRAVPTVLGLYICWVLQPLYCIVVFLQNAEQLKHLHDHHEDEITHHMDAIKHHQVSELYCRALLMFYFMCCWLVAAITDLHCPAWPTVSTACCMGCIAFPHLLLCNQVSQDVLCVFVCVSQDVCVWVCCACACVCFCFCVCLCCVCVAVCVSPTHSLTYSCAHSVCM